MESNSTKVRWSTLKLFSASNREERPTEQELQEALREWRAKGSILEWCFEPVGGEWEREDDQSTWGPKDADAVDWTGFDIPLAIRSQPSRMPRGGTAWIIYRTDTGEMHSSSQSETSERDRLAYLTSGVRFDGGVTYRLATDAEIKRGATQYRLVVGEKGNTQGHVIDLLGQGLDEARASLEAELERYAGDGWGRIEYTMPEMNGWERMPEELPVQCRGASNGCSCGGPGCDDE